MDTISSPHVAEYPVAAVMRRVHAELSTGALPTVDVLLVLDGGDDRHTPMRAATTAA